MTDAVKPCPSCGHCPTCGNQPKVYPYWVLPQQQIYTYRLPNHQYPRQVWC